MKKLLLIICLISAINTKAQDFWTEYATSQPLSSTGISSISIVDQNTTWLSMRSGLVSAADMRRYAKTVNGGTIWTTAAIDLGANSLNLEIANIHGISASVAYAAVYPTVAQARGGIWKTIDGGTTWAKQTSAAFSDPSSFTDLVYFWNANEGVTVGDATNGYFEIYTTNDGGNNWTRVPSISAPTPIDPQEYVVLNNFTTNGNTIWIGTAFGRILKSSDKGMTWTVKQSPIQDFGTGINSYIAGDMAFTDQNNGLLQTNEFMLYNTSDGGATWSEMIVDGVLRTFDIAAVPGMPNAYVSVGEDIDFDERGSSYSIDGGLTWIGINNNPDTNYVDGGQIAMFNEDYGFASGFSNTPTEGGIFRWGGGPMLRMAQLAVSTFTGDKSITVAPNPTSGVLNISGKNISQIKVYDAMGKQIMDMNYNTVNNANINLDALANGIYLANVTNDKGTSVIKVVKQ